jgi:hypothetical protein
VGQVLESSHDYLGRWTRTVFSGKDGKRIAVYNSYQVGKANPSTQGEKTIINQLYSIFIQEGRSNTNPRYNHYADLSSAVKADVDLGFAIILGGDFNEDISIGTATWHEHTGSGLSAGGSYLLQPWNQQLQYP